MNSDAEQGRDVHFSRMCVIGVGLIGGSLARAARRAGLCGTIIGAGRGEAHLERARELGVIDEFDTNIAAAVSDADLVVVAVPMGAMSAVLREVAMGLPAGAVVTDVGSAKASVVADARAVMAGRVADFVPGHPIAGTEKSGVEASFAELFEGRRVILTPLDETRVAAAAQVRGLWEAVGAEVVEMPVEHHDEVLAATSHLPHVLAYQLVDTLARLDDRIEIFDFAAGGFRDFTRIASSDPDMWHDICVANSSAIVEVLQRFQEDLRRLGEAIQHGDSDAIQDVFSRAKQARDQFCGD